MLVWLSVWRARCRLVYGQLMPLPLTVSCFSKIQIGFTFLVPAHLGSPGQRAVTRVCVCWRSNVHVPMLEVVYMFFPINFLFVTCRPSGHFYHFSSARNRKTHLMGQKPALTTAIIHYIMQNHIRQLNYTHIMTWLITMGSGGISRGPSRVGISENFIREHSRICVQNTLD